MERSIQTYQRLGEQLAACLAATESPWGLGRLRLWENRCACSVEHLRAIEELEAIAAFTDDAHPERLGEAEKAQVRRHCAQALAHSQAYQRLHLEEMPDRGCQGTLVSYWATIPVYIDHVLQYFAEGGKAIEPDTSLPYTLELRDVSFRYPGAEKDTLSHIDLTVRPGEKLAIVGLNGAGKTTLMKLCCGLLDPTGGQVLLNGEDIRDFNRRDYYRLFSTVFQDFSVFDTTFADNVTQVPESPDTAGMEDAVKRAGLWEKYQSLPQGGATHIGQGIYEDGLLLSGGELQRLMLARALYKNGPIIILDEPTAALDPVAEMEVYENFDKIVGDKTAVYISHRLSSCRFCDDIAVFDHGHIVQQGSHDALVEAPGKYQELWHAQAQYYAKQEKEPGVE